MIKLLFQWLDLHPGSYWVIGALATALLLTWIGVLVRQELRQPSRRTRAGWTDAVLLLLFVLAWRWPYLLIADELNPDESQFIAGAITLTHDPVFWRAVDTGSSGPLNIYVLLPWRWLGLPLDYFTARLAGVLLICAALFTCLRTLTNVYGRRAVAWLGVLPAAAFFATLRHSDLIHFSSEHLPLLLVAAPACLLAVREPKDRVRLWTALFIAGAAPWAKLQTVPLALALIGWAGVQVLQSAQTPLKRRLLHLAVAALFAVAPSALVALLTLATGQFENAFRRYFVHNLSYVSQGTQSSVFEAFRQFANFAVQDGQLIILLAVLLAAVAVVAARCFARRVRPPALVVAGGWLAAASIAALLAPRREYLHYLLLLPVPFTLWGGAAIGAWWESLSSSRSRRLLAIGLILAGGIAPVVLHGRRPVPAIYGDLCYHWRHPRTSVAVVVRTLVDSPGSLAVWGWACHLYVETALPQATRDGPSSMSILPGSQREHYRKIYLSDLHRHNPEVFVDAVGPRAFVFNKRLEQGHETFPELADYIRSKYVLVADLVEARIYARRDLPTLSLVGPSRLDELVSRGRLRVTGPLPVPPPVVPLEQYTRKIVERHNVVMLLPPSQMEWILDADIRQVALEFGVDPVVWLQGDSDGADLTLDLVSPAGQVRQVYHRFLDPAKQPDDRAPCNAMITLPPFPAGTRLVLHTTAGPSGNNAWDWLYLDALKFHRSPAFLPEQFPGFQPVPDFADAVNSRAVADHDRVILLMHAPASIGYTLGSQSRLQFRYGFQPGAYSDGGNTDGAIVRVSLQQTGQPDRVLFERRLDPVREPADRGPQQLDLSLPPTAGGAQLVIRIDPGPNGNAAWDWTYLGNLTLK